MRASAAVARSHSGRQKPEQREGGGWVGGRQKAEGSRETSEAPPPLPSLQLNAIRPASLPRHPSAGLNQHPKRSKTQKTNPRLRPGRTLLSSPPTVPPSHCPTPFPIIPNLSNLLHPFSPVPPCPMPTKPTKGQGRRAYSVEYRVLGERAPRAATQQGESPPGVRRGAARRRPEALQPEA